MGSAPALEAEIRLALPDDASPEAILAALAPRLQGPVVTHSCLDHYLDHPGLLLLAQRLALRVRVLPERSWVELKGEGVLRDGVWHRPEWRQEAPENWSRRPGDLAEGPVRRGLSLARLPPETPLSGLCVCQVSRQVVPVALDGGGVAELSLDCGEVRAGGARQAIRELELEWRSGPQEGLTRLAAELTRAHGLVPAPASKFRIGLSLRQEGLGCGTDGLV
ncbi:MAG: CYTH domain-containing protein [Magnetococcales bacterium]|nr:CYTH domain-containing protein [Magnetococcales bacterium]